MRIGVDIGGTFTDLVGVDEKGTIHVAKTPSTPEDPSIGVIDGLRLLADQVGTPLAQLLADTTLFIHGTTVATNLLIERKGANLGLITTKGFRDLLELREGTKQNRYQLREPFPQPLITRPRRREVPERVRWDGSVETPLDETAVRAELEHLRTRGVKGVVVCFLHSHRNPAHERRVREIAAEIGWDPYLSLSHEVLNREGEYDRVSTATVNAYVGPGLGGYLNRLSKRLAEAGARVTMLVMQSTGGVLPVRHAIQYAVGAVTSGPAGGAMAGALFARLGTEKRMVTYDMGGTSTDICLVQGGVPLERQKTEMKDVKIAVPTLDIGALGAGGGSIAWIDSGGILDLGPHSAGAVPGPACYGRGGKLPTLTDANLVLGYISGETFLGGRLPLTREKAAAALETHVSGPLGLSVEEAALAINALASSRIAEGIRAATVRRGLDPRDFSLFSFGGAGGLHADAVARELLVPKAIIPREASVLSALGFLTSDVRHDFQRTVAKSVPHLDPAELRQTFAEIEAEGRRLLNEEGFADDKIQVLRMVDCRYLRQVFTVEVRIDEADLKEADLGWLVKKFEAAYEALYHHVHKNEHGFVDTCRITVLGELPTIELPRQRKAGRDPSPAQRGRRRVYFGKWTEAPVYWFDDLRHGMAFAGPALIDSPSTTVLVPAGSTAEVDPLASVVITPSAA
ncbi:MAG: hydantoinase/oxoprolinase family protein [Proteobacteria bacterium]|nr:hydantoinase/oxoprolinase family protein [Pseudomonadota bacterium]